MAAVYKAPLVSHRRKQPIRLLHPGGQQMAHMRYRPTGPMAYGIPGVIVDGNDVEAVYAAVKEAVERARAGGGPTLIEAKTMRMLGHAIHDGAEYVPQELAGRVGSQGPRDCFTRKLLESGVTDQDELDEIGQRAEVEVEDAIDTPSPAPGPTRPPSKRASMPSDAITNPDCKQFRLRRAEKLDLSRHDEPADRN